MKKIFLVGNPNAGKSTVFNMLTNSQVHTGNWHGVTVTVTSKECTLNRERYTIYDLPGTYDLVPFSNEERITTRMILDNPDALFVNIVDVNNLDRALNLVCEMLELGVKCVVALNFIEAGKRRGVAVGLEALSRALGVPVFALSHNKRQIQSVFSRIVSAKITAKPPKYLELFDLDKIAFLLTPYCAKNYLKYNALRVREGATDGMWECKLPLNVLPRFRTLELTGGLEHVVSTRKDFIKEVVRESKKSTAKTPYGWSKLDKIILNKYLALPVFFAVMLVIFYLTFGFFGGFLSEISEYVVVEILGGWLLGLLDILSAPAVVVNFFENAVISGVGSVFSFLPQILLLLLFLEILEQSGYISRLAWILEPVFNRIGLSGRSVFGLLLGFGCSTTAIPTTATIKNDRARIKTAILIPFMSCSAKLPVFSVIGGAVFGVNNALIIFSLYLLGVAVALLIALILNKMYPTNKTEEIVEFTPMRVPSAREIFSIVWQNTRQFLHRLVFVVLGCTIIIWVLDNFTFTLKFIINEGEVSMLESISKFLAPLFSPMGLGFGAVCALIFGLIAKELVLSSIAILNGVTGVGVAASIIDSASVVCFTPASALAFLTFCLLYSPCISAISQLKSVVGGKITAIYLGLQFLLAYALGVLAYYLGVLVESVGVSAMCWVLMCVVFVVICVEIALISLTRGRCQSCKRCQIDFKSK